MSATVIVIRAVYFAAALQLFGLLTFSRLVAPMPRRGWAWLLTAAVFLAMTAWLAAAAAMMSGEPVSAGTVALVLRETRFGTAWIARAILLAAIAVLVALPGRAAGFAAAAAAALVLAFTAVTDHAGATGNRFELGADVLHLLAVGAWLGGLAPFAIAMRRRDAAAIAWRFSTVATVCVCVILATGIVNAWFLVGTLRALTGTDYGRVLLLKLALFAVMLAVAAANRFYLVPRGAAAALRRNALIETGLGLAIIGVVAVLGTMAPGYYQTSATLSVAPVGKISR